MRFKTVFGIGFILQLAFVAACLFGIFMGIDWCMTKFGAHQHGAESHANHWILTNEVEGELLGCIAMNDMDDRYRCPVKLQDGTKITLVCDGYFGDSVCSKP